MTPRTILVTGGAGFIGGCFIRQTLSENQDCRIINLDKLTYASDSTSIQANDPAQYVLIEGDIGDTELTGQLLKKFQPEWVVHFAAESHVDRSIDAPDAFIQTNVVGTYRLLDSVLLWWRGLPIGKQDQFRFLQISTDEVFGSLDIEGYFSEQSRYVPNSPYSASKAAADHFVRAYHQTYELPVLTTNCSNNYGPYQFPDKLIPLVIGKAVKGQSIPIYGDGMNIRDWIYVEDHCHAIRTVLERGTVGEAYNIGGDSERTNLQVAEAICDVVDELSPSDVLKRRESITFVADRPGHDRRYAIDCSKIRSELGWAPVESFESGLQRTVKWYLEHSDWTESIATGRYNGERLGVKLDFPMVGGQ